MFKSSKFLISSPRLVTNLIKSVSKLPFDLDLGINVSIPLRHLSIAARFYCTEMPEKKPFSRLPTEVAPVNYALRLKPNLEAFTFEGYQEIGIEVNCLVLAQWQSVQSCGIVPGHCAVAFKFFMPPLSEWYIGLYSFCSHHLIQKSIYLNWQCSMDIVLVYITKLVLPDVFYFCFYFSFRPWQ